MLKVNYAVYSVENKENPASGFISENNFFLVFEAEGLSQDKIKEEFTAAQINNLNSLDQFVSKIITKYNLSPTLSMAVGYLNQNLMYLKSVGTGKIFLKRGNNFAAIISGDKSASGYINRDDFYLFATDKFENILKNVEIKTAIGGRDPDEFADFLKSSASDENVSGGTALFVKIEDDLPPAKSDTLTNNYQTSPVVEKLKERVRIMGMRRILTVFAVICIFIILVWSVVLGVSRRKIAEINLKIKTASEIIDQKLVQAEESAFLNISKSMLLLSEAKKELAGLRNQLDEKNKDVSELEKKIKETENRIVKKEDKNYSEFYDLTVDSKGAKGNKFYLEGEILSIIDNEKSTIYKLSLTKKSLDKKSSNVIKKAGFTASYKDYNLIYVTGEGIYKLDQDDKPIKIIDKDDDWGLISSIWIYNGNLYLLDSGKGDIYKYLVTETGYSKKSSYLGSGILKTSNSLAIDSSIYVGFEDQILKFTAGVKDGFKTSWPDKNIRLTKIFTSTDLEKVYAWDKNNGRIYILGKNGSYDRQINSSILTKGSDFVIYSDSAYILVGQKIYKIDLK